MKIRGLLLVLLASLCAAAAEVPLIPREVLFGNPEKLSPRISPDGTRLAYVAPHEGVLNVWLKTLGRNDDRPLTKESHRGIQEVWWQPDGEHLLFLKDRDGDENYHVYQLDVTTGERRDLTPHEGVQAEILRLDPNHPHTALIGMNLRDRTVQDVYRLDLRTGEAELAAENPGDVEQWVADNELVVRSARARLGDASTEIRVRDAADQPWRVLLKWAWDELPGTLVGFSPDGKRLWVVSSVGSDTGRLLEIDVATGKNRVVAHDRRSDPQRVLLHASQHTLMAVRYVFDRAYWRVLDPSVRADFSRLERTHPGDFDIVSMDRENRRWIVEYESDVRPSTYNLYDRGTKRLEFLFSTRPKLEEYPLAATKPVSYRAADGMLIHAYLTRAKGRQPLVVWVHGGPWDREYWGFHAGVQWLANRGYAVLMVNFRGSTGYGKAYVNASNGERGGKMNTDLVDGKNWAVKQGYADPKRTCVYGVSYGGYATLAALAFTPQEWTCGAEAFGASNMISLIRSFPPWWKLYKLEYDRRVGKLGEEDDKLRAISPLFKIDRIRAPLLIAHGANDPRVVKAESDQVVEALRKAGKEVEYIVFPDEGHGFLRPQNRLRWYAAMEAFLAKHLGGRAEP